MSTPPIRNDDQALPTMRKPGKPRSLVAWMILGVAGRSSIPELKHCRSDFELTEAAARAKVSRPTLRDILPVIVFVSIFVSAVVGFRTIRPAWLPEWMLLVFVMGTALTFALFMSSWTQERSRLNVRRYLISRGIALCHACGYDLSASPGGVTPSSPCPECGKAMGDVATLLAKRSEVPTNDPRFMS